MKTSVTTVALLFLAAACGPVAPPVKIPQAVDHVSAGTAAFSAGDLDRAEAEFHVALEYDSEMAEALNGLGLVAFARKDFERARQRFQEALIKKDEFAEGHANLGAVELELKHAEMALPHLRAALDIDPGFVPARQNLAEALRQVGRMGEAREELMKLSTIAADNPHVWAALGYVELALGHRAAAGRANLRALDLDPEYPLALRVKASLLRDGGDLAGALAQFETLLAKTPSDAELLVDRGITLLLLGRRDDARKDVERATELAPRSVSAHFARGIVAAESEQDVQAIESLTAALAAAEALGKPYPRARYFLAGALARQGRRKEALAAYEKFLQEANEDALSDLLDAAKSELQMLKNKRSVFK